MRSAIALVVMLIGITDAHAFDPTKSGKAVVTTKSGHSCSFDVVGSEKPDKQQIDQMTTLCEREERGQAILGITGTTNRDFANMGPDHKKAYRCSMVRQKIEVQLDLQAAGSSGYYNIDTLRQLERQECGSNQP